MTAGGATQSCTRSTRARSPTRTGTGSATSRRDGAARISRVARRRRDLAQPDPPVAERRLGLRRRRTTRRYIPTSARSRTSTDSSRRPARAGSACCSISSRTTRPTRHPWFRERARLLRLGRTRSRTTGSRSSAAARRGRSTTSAASTTSTTSPRSSRTSNWWNPEVAPEFERILRFWFDRGVAGFRIDVAHAIYQGPRAARRPGRSPGSACVAATRCSGPRRTTSCSAGARSPRRTTRRGSSSARRTRSTSSSGPATSASRATSSTSLSRSCSSHADLDAEPDAHRRRRGRGGSAGRRVAVLDGLEPRHRPPRDPLGRRRRAPASAAR